MQISTIPVKIPVVWGQSAAGSYIRAVPAASQIGISDGAASFTDGFPPLCFQPIEAGGVPPDGRDINGVLNLISAWVRWHIAGGPISFDSDFSAAIGGYPNGAVLASSTTPGLFWRSTADNNGTNPDGGSPANWLPVTLKDFGGATGSVNGLQGLVPRPLIADAKRVLGGGGSWSDLFTLTTNANGTCKTWLNGYKEQRGITGNISGDAPATVTFPVAFAAAPAPQDCMACIYKLTPSSGQDNMAEVNGTPTTTQMQVYNNQTAGGGNAQIIWRAEGL